MAKEGRRPPSDGRPASGAGGKSASRMEQPFDHWLHKQLHQMYDSIASEPLPDDLLRLIDKDADRASVSEPDKSHDGDSGDHTERSKK